MFKEFEKSSHPSKNKITELSKIVNLNEKATMKWFTNRRYKLRHLNNKDSTSHNRLDDYDESNNDLTSTINKTDYKGEGAETTPMEDQSIISEKSNLLLSETSSTVATTSKTTFHQNCIFYEIID